MKTLIAPLLALSLAACATTSHVATPSHPEAKSFAVSEDAGADVDAALERAMASGKHVLLVMGANWCHDSRALAGWLETPRFQELVEAEYELVFVNVGLPQTGDGHISISPTASGWKSRQALRMSWSSRPAELS